MAPWFELLEHPSDIGVRAQGATREEALVAASQGVMSILADTANFRPIEERFFKASGADEATLIINWLNEILFFFDTEVMVFSDFSIDSWTADEITGHARGERLDVARHEFRTAVKAVTYHQFKSHQTRDGWEIRVFVDV